jgi:lysosomal acid lipase/cholesteryl ester hydrolase
MFYALSKWPELYKEKINLFVALAPAVNILHTNQPILKLVTRVGGTLERRLEKFGLYEIFGQGWSKEYGWIKNVLPISRKVKIRSDMMDMELDEGDRNEMLMGHFPHGTSLRSLNHLGQLIKNGDFAEYDYRKKKNIEKYAQEKAPLVPLEDISKA